MLIFSQASCRSHLTISASGASHDATHDTFHQVLGFLEAKTSHLTDNLDHADLLAVLLSFDKLLNLPDRGRDDRGVGTHGSPQLFPDDSQVMLQLGNTRGISLRHAQPL